MSSKTSIRAAIAKLRQPPKSFIVIPDSYAELEMAAIEWKIKKESEYICSPPNKELIEICPHCGVTFGDNHISTNAVWRSFWATTYVAGTLAGGIGLIGLATQAFEVSSALALTVCGSGGAMAMVVIRRFFHKLRHAKLGAQLRTKGKLAGIVSEYLRTKINAEREKFLGKDTPYDRLQKRAESVGELVKKIRQELESRQRFHADGAPERFQEAIDRLTASFSDNLDGLQDLKYWAAAANKVCDRAQNLIDDYIGKLSEAELFQQTEVLVGQQLAVSGEISHMIIEQTRLFQSRMLEIGTSMQFRLATVDMDNALNQLSAGCFLSPRAFFVIFSILVTPSGIEGPQV